MDAARTSSGTLAGPRATSSPEHVALTAALTSALLRPFPGLRYDPTTVGPLFRLLAPPHTELDKTARTAFLASSPYAVTHLERPEYGDGEGPEVHRWLAEGALVQDGPGFYVVRQHEGAQAQHFLLGSLRVVPDDPRVHPHEGVFEQAVGARLKRLEETAVDSEPVLVVDTTPWPVPWTRPETLGRLVTSVPDATGAPLVDVWHLDDPEVVAALGSAAAEHRFIIADGHHRYAAVRRAAHRSGHPEDLLVAVVNQPLEPVRLLALHRVLPLDAAELVQARAIRHRDVRVDDVAAALSVQAGLGAEQALLLLPGRAVVVEGSESAGRTVGSGAWVDTVVRSSGINPDRVRYRSDVQEVWDAVGPSQGAVLLPRPTVAGLDAVVSAGRMMGRKTTSFRPKPLAGSVLRLR